MNIGLFGGTFDPIHKAHLALARAARERFKLARIFFVPANIPPHKHRQSLLAFPHRYAMIALATAQEKDFAPSLLEAPEEVGSESTGKEKARAAKPNYTIDTVKRLKQSFKKVDRLFLLVGIDAFADIAKWHQAEALFRECEAAGGSDASVSQAGGHGGFGAEGCDHPSAGRGLPADFFHRGSGCRSRRKTVGPVCGTSGCGLHQENGAVQRSLVASRSPTRSARGLHTRAVENAAMGFVYNGSSARVGPTTNDQRLTSA
jgi:nicotinate (nicotinamide) nucleotide adenylyltransferase